MLADEQHACTTQTTANQQRETMYYNTEQQNRRSTTSSGGVLSRSSFTTKGYRSPFSLKTISEPPSFLLALTRTRRKMRAKAKKVMVKKIKKASQLSVPSHKSEDADFLPLKGGPGRKLPDQEAPVDSNATVLYIGRIPHGFYEKEMEGFFKQFGTIKRLRIARNKKTGKSKHFGFIEFESPEVAKIVADSMHNYLLFEHMLQVDLVPPERVHLKLWNGANRIYKPLNWTQIEQKRHNKERTKEEHKKLVERILKRNQKRKKKIEAAGIEYECTEIVGSIQPASKKIKFDDESE
ncbi:hypothetical protein NE237_015295 [Protea cynaroides]|uniref:RRM domain-containing protein n=1 Tax=Protea cynaroides TaxID=273540 RepID=A0A9Q0QR35_9MAGN|nr:hypothetical protein NE237_015295 [Protea cynaroides]